MKRFIYNNETKPLKSQIRLLWVYIVIFFKNLFRGKDNKIDYLFFYSKEQDSLDFDWASIGVRRDITYVKGVEYSEMREIGNGFSNWGDAYIIAYGNNSDISY